jgi:hypothetical protein
MKRNLLIFLVSASVGGLSACAKEQIDPELEKRIVEKLGNIEKRLDSIEKGGGVRSAAGPEGRQQRPPAERPPGPDPKETYAVPIEGSTTKGPKFAKVTLVEAFEFA